MTKISQLNINTSVDNSAVLPVVSNNATYKATVGNLNGVCNTGGSSSTFGGLVSPDEMYGTVASVSIESGGANYTADITYAAAHDDTSFNKVPGINNATYNCQRFIARGLHVRVVTVGASGAVTSLEITNPGQLYKVGDLLEVSPWKVHYNTSGSGETDTTITELCKIKVTEVNPFVVGYGIQYNLGGSVQNLYDNGVSTPHDPNTGITNADGLKGYVMQEDSSATLFQETFNKIDNEDWHQSGTRSTWLGPRHNSTSNGQLSIALPGHWFLVHHTKIASDTKEGGTSGFSYTAANTQVPALSDSLIPSAGNVYSDTSTSAMNVGGARVINVNFNAHTSLSDLRGDFNSMGSYANSCLTYCSKNIESTFTDAKNNMGSLPSFLETDATNWGLYAPAGGSFSSRKFFGVWDAMLTPAARGGSHIDRTAFFDTRITNGSFCHSFYCVPAYAILPSVS
jgi:hypothetical protein